MIHSESIGTFFFIIGAYCAFTAFLQYAFYTRPAASAKQWKLQPNRVENVGNETARRWWLPFLNSPKARRHPRLWLWGTINLVNSAAVGAFTAECILRGWSRVVLPSKSPPWTAPSWIAAQVLSHAVQGTLEYLWHRMMHSEWFFERFHIHHHYYLSPEVYDDMMIHPLEAFLYYFILYSPAFLVRQPLSSFVAFMVINGLFGVLDHCGIDFELGLYRTRDHDAHHALVNVNFSFPFPVLDILCGTYYGRFLGMDFVPWAMSATELVSLKKRELSRGLAAAAGKGS
ncbi:C-4 sterol methyl oxidase [Hyaloraphidium curvatum]|nr:C-4 sterol methyl oxidase [Hyaloraphidium curvatum]